MSCVLQEDCAIEVYEGESVSRGGRRGINSVRCDWTRDEMIRSTKGRVPEKQTTFLVTPPLESLTPHALFWHGRSVSIGMTAEGMFFVSDVLCIFRD